MERELGAKNGISTGGRWECENGRGKSLDFSGLSYQWVTCLD